MYNLRYHIASLVGVFLALALGLVLGGLVVQRGTIDKQQGSLVEGLQREFATLRADNEVLEADNERLSELSDVLVDAWVADRLVGKNVVVIAPADSGDGESASTAVSAAGGNPILVTLSDAQWAASIVSEPADPADVSASSEVTASVVASLVAEWQGPTTDRPVTERLIEADVISVEGLEPGMAAAGVINLASWGDEPDATALAIAAGMGETDVVAIAAQTPDSTSRLAATSAGAGLSAIDTLGTSMGRYSLVALLAGAQPGYYGLAEQASAPFPAIP